MSSIHNMATDALKELGRQQQEHLLEQLHEHVSRGLIKLEVTSPQIYQTPDGKFQLAQTTKFILSEQEYIERLEQEIVELKLKLHNIASAVANIEVGN